MKILLDENIDRSFKDSLSSFSVYHVVDLGWQGRTNGALIASLEAEAFDALITADKRIRFQQNLAKKSFCVLGLDIHPNVLPNQIACVNSILVALNEVTEGGVFLITPNEIKKVD